jgi:hypothetical protein
MFSQTFLLSFGERSLMSAGSSTASTLLRDPLSRSPGKRPVLTPATFSRTAAQAARLAVFARSPKRTTSNIDSIELFCISVPRKPAV